ncbi:MAG: hypothetical protein RLP02_19875, partial [Coleofasciculus sp. C2-GNP5-27]
MNENLALAVLGGIMNWSDETARVEFGWLRMMARLKYDGYRDFEAGAGFLESLASWLQQYSPEDREAAYSFVKDRLVFISPGEKQRLVGQFYPRIIHERLIQIVSAQLGIPPYLLLAQPEAEKAIERLRRQTLIMGLSDGAQIDVVRHANIGRLSNEQIVPMTQIDKGKWEDLLGELRIDLNDQAALFKLVFLVDDFTASGNSFLRWNSEKKKWSGKLIRFSGSVAAARGAGVNVLDPDWRLSIHHYISSAQADENIRACLDKAQTALSDKSWASDTCVTSGLLLPNNLRVTEAIDPGFVALSQKYYNDSIQTKHTDTGGVKHIGLGYAGCALPLVLEHNTPNNSVALLWAET